MKTNEETEPAVSAAQVIRIAGHYHKAKTKHPYFADRLFHENQWRDHIGADLGIVRQLIEAQVRLGCVEAYTLLQCELLEAAVAHLGGDKAAVVGKLYDAIAVILRMVDVVEGRQALGRAEEAAR